jgi:glyoxylase-like metal-dependent hydrolase (beta-lactamase superfamily II)
MKHHVEPVVSPLFDQVAYVVWRQGQSRAIVVDPGFDTASLISLIRRHGLALEAIVNTHGHADHIAGNAELKRCYPDTPLMIGRNDSALLTNPELNLSKPFGMPLTSPPAERLLDEGERVELGGLEFLVREIPGHSPGSIVLIAQGAEPPFVLAGDVLFSGSVGRTDFPGGSTKSLLEGIREKLYTLADETIVYPGHGPATTIGQEKRSNPFVSMGRG